MFNENDTREDRINVLMDLIEDTEEDLEIAAEGEKVKIYCQLVVLKEMLADI